MVIGVGTDLVEIRRMEKSLESPAFWRRVFGHAERAFLEARPKARRAASAAANFAAKEAFLKAAGKGLGSFALAEIQILRGEGGAPYYLLSGGAAAWAAERGAGVRLSLAHEGGLALAFAVAETSAGSET